MTDQTTTPEETEDPGKAARRAAYEARRAAKYERFTALAAKAGKESESRLKHAHQMADIIPFGQPILVGHYSEGRDRNFRARIDGNFRKGFELSEKAAYYSGRAASIQDNTAIFSDDPDAAEKLGGKLEQLKQRQELMKSANKLVKKGDRTGLAALGFSPSIIEGLFTPDFGRQLGFPSYRITNNGAEIRRLEKRLKVIEAHANDETTEKILFGIKIKDSVEDNRIQIFFPGKPSDECRSELKHSGFRWSPTGGCWQAYRGYHPSHAADSIVTKYYGCAA